MKNIQNKSFHKEIQQVGQKKMQCDCKNGNSEISFFHHRSIFLLSVFLRGLLQYNRFNLNSLLRGEAVIFRKRYRKGMRFIFLAEPFDLSLKDACPPKRLWLLGFAPYSHSIAIFFCEVVAWKATFLCPYAPIKLWSKANSASFISYTL